MRLVEIILDNKNAWYYTRKILDVVIGSYRLRQPYIHKYAITDNQSVLDVGCGTGEHSTLAKGEYLGIDLDNNYIELATEKFGTANKKFRTLDLNTLRPSDKKYDVGLLIDLTHHISDKELESLLKKLGTVINETIVICDPIKQHPANLLGRCMTFLDRGHFIRPKNDLLSLVKKVYKDKRIDVNNIQIGPIETVCIFVYQKR